MNTSVICPHCGQPFEISQAIGHQIEEELLRARREQSESLKKEMEKVAEKRLREAVEGALAQKEQEQELLLARERQQMKLALERQRQEARLAAESALRQTELETERLKQQAKSADESLKENRAQIRSLLEELSQARKAQEEAQIAARRELMEREALIRREAAQKASDDFNTKIREQEETISRLREQLTSAKQVAEQGSQQLQGEILELDVEAALRAAFPLDSISEVKKGERGSDIRQVVNERLYQNCGLILWECKNAKSYQQAWLGKLKDELAEEKAQIGVIVFSPPDGGGSDYERLGDSVWLVKPRYAAMLGALLREVLVRVFIANRNNEGRDVKTEMVYNYLTGGEFASRVRYIIDAYGEMAAQLDAEKKQAQKRWAAQEKILQKVTASLYGMSGDLQGIAGKEIIALPGTEDSAGAD